MMMRVPSVPTSVAGVEDAISLRNILVDDKAALFFSNHSALPIQSFIVKDPKLSI